MQDEVIVGILIAIVAAATFYFVGWIGFVVFTITLLLIFGFAG